VGRSPPGLGLVGASLVLAWSELTHPRRRNERLAQANYRAEVGTRGDRTCGQSPRVWLKQILQIAQQLQPPGRCNVGHVGVTKLRVFVTADSYRGSDLVKYVETWEFGFQNWS